MISIETNEETVDMLHRFLFTLREALRFRTQIEAHSGKDGKLFRKGILSVAPKLLTENLGEEWEDIRNNVYNFRYEAHLQLHLHLHNNPRWTEEQKYWDSFVNKLKELAGVVDGWDVVADCVLGDTEVWSFEDEKARRQKLDQMRLENSEVAESPFVIPSDRKKERKPDIHLRARHLNERLERVEVPEN